ERLLRRVQAIRRAASMLRAGMVDLLRLHLTGVQTGSIAPPPGPVSVAPARRAVTSRARANAIDRTARIRDLRGNAAKPARAGATAVPNARDGWEQEDRG